MRHLIGIAIALLLAGAGSSLVGFSALLTALSVRQALRAAPFHPFGAAAGLLVLPLGIALWLFARERLDDLSDRRFAAWRLRELS